MILLSVKQTCVLSVSGGVTESLQHDAVCSLNTETITELQMFLRLVQTEKQKAQILVSTV